MLEAVVYFTENVQRHLEIMSTKRSTRIACFLQRSTLLLAAPGGLAPHVPPRSQKEIGHEKE